MKAAYINGYGGLEVIRYGDIPDPVPTDDNILVQVKAVSINPADFKLRSGIIKIVTGSKFPKVLGMDFSGIIKTVGSKVSGFKTGDRVYGNVPIFFGKQGALAELVVSKPERLRLIPDGMSFEQAASLPVAALTALNGLRKSGNLIGKTVLVNGATGGVGHFAIQIAKARQAKVIAVCSRENNDLAKQFGADFITDYSKTGMSDIEPVDIIYDAYGKMKPKTIIKLLKKNGIYTSTLFLPHLMLLSPVIGLFFGKKLKSSNMRAKPEDYQQLEDLFAEKKLIPYIDNTFALQDTIKAFDLLENAKPRGKIIVTVN